MKTGNEMKRKTGEDRKEVKEKDWYFSPWTDLFRLISPQFSASEMTCIVSSGALNSTHSPLRRNSPSGNRCKASDSHHNLMT